MEGDFYCVLGETMNAVNIQPLYNLHNLPLPTRNSIVNFKLQMDLYIKALY